MCLTCRHWRRDLAFDEAGRLFAPCGLMPDRMVRDSRCPGGKTPQAYATSETYNCPHFEETGSGQEQNSG